MSNRQLYVGISLLLVIILATAFKLTATKGYAADFQIKAANLIIDQAGRKLKFDKPFKRIISLYGAHTENLFDLGLADEIIGVSRHETSPPQALQKPVFSYRDDPEKFLAVRPDLVIIRPMIDRGYPQFVSMLEKNNITIVSLQPGNVEDMYQYWRILGLLSGKQQRAMEMASRFKAAVLEFRSLTDARIFKKRVYFEAIHSKMKTFTPDSMAVFALEAAGGINIASDAKPVRNTNIAYYGKERILSHGGEIDVFLAQVGTMNQATIRLIANESGFNSIKAVAAGEIHLIDEQIVSRPTMRLLEGIHAIGKILYPTDFNNKSLAILNRAKDKY